MMIDKIFLWLLIYLQLSLFLHILFIILYIAEKSNSSFRGFLATTFSNFAIGLSILYVLTKEPLVLKRFSFAPFLIIESGLVFSFLILLKVWITLRIWRRMKDPENYDISFFGKKVYKQDVVKKGELAAYFLTLPFTLISGAYFLVNIFSK
ncbi:MAG: hypothetical protein BWY23_00217 [Spirochaetes bacterium ADurb.Bin218]|jgi:hypothetical protein|nr:hypothetical protein [Spirochaetota bacterium]OQB00400.1 MAG: hypothetical protein BWY23_00217 [Spirochaetes bacterium ADurb.Bin218]HOK93049.1 hypothetical protein [Spirochaetota bacterium]HOQ10771.1 hypothetical protein [Spirochaetota bacterium]HOV08304.1 hypothetical protein [Spirochaetota bacterium]